MVICQYRVGLFGRCVWRSKSYRTAGIRFDPALFACADSFNYRNATRLRIGACFLCGSVLRPERPLKRIANDWVYRFQVQQQLTAALPVLLCLPAFMSAFTSFKILIPLLHPFSWDPALAILDRAIHGGIDPWRLLHPILGYPTVTAIVNVLYHKWFLVVNGVLLWQAVAIHDRCLRQQFFLTFILSSILIGSVTAMLVPAAGPCYFGKVTGLQDPFEPLISYLATVHDEGLNPAFAVQEWLWRHYSSGDLVIGGGISAMPSMHVAFATLFVLLGFRRSRLLGWFMYFSLSQF